MDELKNSNEIMEFETALSCFSPIGLESKSSKAKYTDFSSNIFYLSDLHLDFYIDPKKNVESQIESIVDQLIRNTPFLYGLLYPDKDLKDITDEQTALETVEFIHKSYLYDKYILLGGDIAESPDYSRLFYHKIRQAIPNYRIIAVLGNHELAAFKNIDDAFDYYSNILRNENIVLLENVCLTDMNFETRQEFTQNHKYDGVVYEWPNHQNCTHALCFYGGIGFNKFDNEHTVETIRISQDIQGNLELEKKLCDSFVNGYNIALDYAKSHQQVLVVLSHYPLNNWLDLSECDGYCYYFYGHDHSNKSYESNGALVFGDGQIGYHSKEFSFKSVSLGKLCNPFYSYDDGYFVVSLENYIQFNVFAGEGHVGGGACKGIRSRLNKGYELYMIKNKGYYGFFLIKGTSIFICEGGKVVTIPGNNEGIKYYNSEFENLVNRLLIFLTPYRRFQERISEEVKSVGGSGKMHGLIVDYDFTHHIMINPYDGSLTFYYSPEKGYVQNFRHINDLISHVCKNQIEVDNRMINCKDDYFISKELDEAQLDGRIFDSVIKIDLKDSLYVFSDKMRNLERIFTSGILREWNEDIFADFSLPNFEKLKLLDSQ